MTMLSQKIHAMMQIKVITQLFRSNIGDLNTKAVDFLYLYISILILSIDIRLFHIKSKEKLVQLQIF